MPTYEETRAMLLDLSGRDGRTTILQLWRNQLQYDVKEELVKYMFEDTPGYNTTLKAAMQNIEDNGCSVETGVRMVIYPDEFYK
jgi:hypothetical protein